MICFFIRNFLFLLLFCLLSSGCQSSLGHLRRVESSALEAIEQKQLEALGRTESFSILKSRQTLRQRLLLEMGLPYASADSLSIQNDLLEEESMDLPGPPWPRGESFRLSLEDALQAGAAGSREYQAAKEEVFRSALDYLLEKNAFQNSYTGRLNSLLSLERSDGASVTGSETSLGAGVSRRLKAGALLTTQLGLDLVRLLTPGTSSSLGLFADASINIPLLRGAGRDIATEVLTQAERNLLYAIWSFERFKASFSVGIARDYLDVLESLDRQENAQSSYRSLVRAGRRAQRLFEAGRLEGIQVDQAVQDELRARNVWIGARQDYQRALDGFKNLLGLPTDARIELDRNNLNRLLISAQDLLSDEPATARGSMPLKASDPVQLEEPSLPQAGSFETDPELVIRTALDRRLDLRVLQGRVYDSRRKVAVSADNLGADLALVGSARIGEGRSLSGADLDNARFQPSRGNYSAALELRLPFERTAEALAYRESLIDYELAVRNFQRLEDQIKAEVREALRNLLEFRESIRIQDQAVKLARRRVESTELFLQAGRAQMRDLLDAQEDLSTARNAFSAALVDYHNAELFLQRDMGTLMVNESGLWREPASEGEADEQSL